jgi:predicted membrane GTPase involved in stress response
VRNEPVEILVVDVPETTAGKVIELVTQRKGELLVMEPKGDLQHLNSPFLRAASSACVTTCSRRPRAKPS